MISSAQNPKVQRVRALLEKRKQRDAEQVFVVEGVRLVEEAQAAGLQPELVLYSETLNARGLAVARAFQKNRAEVLEVTARVMDSATGTETPQGLLAVFPRREMELPRPLDFVLVCDTIRDPGNLGTLLRSAAAAGAQAALLSPGSADAYAPKVLRAGMGAHFHLPILQRNWGEIRALCEQHGLRVFLAEASDGHACWSVDLRQPLALTVSSEADGASIDAAKLADQGITIPMPGQSESLNAAVAASILLFEIVRQRTVHGGGEGAG
jgi:RNA methyltransferase, TrmH family